MQSSALPLGHAAEKDSIESFYDLNSKVSHSLLFICNGHGEDVIASEIIKRLLKKIKNKNIEVLPLVGKGDVFDSITCSYGGGLLFGIGALGIGTTDWG